MKLEKKLGDAIMEKVYIHIIDRQTEKLQSLISKEEMHKFIAELSVEALNIYCDLVGGKAEDFRSFGLINLEGILSGSIDYSDFEAAKEPSEIGS